MVTPMCRIRRSRGWATTDLIMAVAIFAIALLPLAFSIMSEVRLCRAYYYRAVAMEIVDGEMEVLAAGEHRRFQPGVHPYTTRAGAGSQPPRKVRPHGGKRTAPAGVDTTKTQAGRPRRPGSEAPMNLRRSNRSSGMLFLECLVYIGVFFVLTGLAFEAFYAGWDHHRNLDRNVTDIVRTLRAGERWRADVRAATGAAGVDARRAGGVRASTPRRRSSVLPFRDQHRRAPPSRQTLGNHPPQRQTFQLHPGRPRRGGSLAVGPGAALQAESGPGRAPGSASRPCGPNVLAMKTVLPRTRRSRQEASAVLVVFMLVALLSALVAVNTLSLIQLKDELKLIEKQQLRKFELPPARPIAVTNAPTQPVPP